MRSHLGAEATNVRLIQVEQNDGIQSLREGRMEKRWFPREEGGGRG